MNEVTKQQPGIKEAARKTDQSSRLLIFLCGRKRCLTKQQHQDKDLKKITPKQITPEDRRDPLKQSQQQSPMPHQTAYTP